MDTITMEPKTELTVFVEKSGIEKSKGNEITESLGVFFAKAQEWDDIIKSIVIDKPGEVGKMKMCREGRLTLKNLRLDSDKVVKSKRDDIKYRMAADILEDKLWLKSGQMVEATFKNLETQLEEKEKFDEIWNAKIKEAKRVERLSRLQTEFPEFDSQFTDLLNMPDESFNQLVSGLQTAREAQIAEKKAADEYRYKMEQEEAAERERIRVENEKLKAAAIEKEKELEKERAKVEAERKAAELKAQKERIIQQAKADADRKVAELKAKKEREAAAEKLRIEKDKSDKLQAELKAKADAEMKAKKEAAQKDAAELKAQQLADKKAKAAPDKIKLIQFATMLDETRYPECKSEDGKKIVEDTKILMQKIIDFVYKKVDEL